MSDQSEALKKLALEQNIIAPPADPAPEAAGSSTADILNSNLPKIELPGEGTLLSHFARQVARVVKEKFMYRRKLTPLMVNLVDKQLDPVDADAFRSLVEQRLVCFKAKLGRESLITICQTMPVDTARGTLRAPEFLAALPEVERVNTVRLPVMRANNKIELLPEGFDPESKTFTFPPAIAYDEAMTLDTAFGILTSLTSEFPFGDWPEVKDGETGPMKPSRSQAVVIAGMMTMFAAGLLPRRASRPAFIYTSNSPRSGKTLLAQLAVLPVRGSAGRSPWGREEELKKLLDTAVQNGDLYLLFDNLRGHIQSQSLEAFITSDEWEGRVLGSSTKFKAPNLTTIFLTGNSATVNEDMQGRSLFVELFLQEADVQDRKIAREIDADWLMVDKNRAMILSALWALVRDWDVNGRVPNPRRLAGFEAWARTIAGIVQHAGLGDCLEPVVLDHGGNTEMQDMRELLLILSQLEHVGDFEFAKIVETAVAHSLFDWILVDVELSPKEKSMFGKLLKRYACGRIFTYPDEMKLKFGNRGKHRGRRYMITKL